MSPSQSQPRRRGWDDKSPAPRGFLSMASRASEQALPSVATAAAPTFLARRVVSSSELSSTSSSLGSLATVSDAAQSSAANRETKHTHPLVAFWGSFAASAGRPRRQPLKQQTNSRPSRPRRLFSLLMLLACGVALVTAAWSAFLRLELADEFEPVEEAWDEDVDYQPPDSIGVQQLSQESVSVQNSTIISSRDRPAVGKVSPLAIGRTWTLDELRSRRQASCGQSDAQRQGLSLVAVCRNNAHIPLSALASFLGALRDEDELLVVSWDVDSDEDKPMNKEAVLSAVRIASGNMVAIISCFKQVPSLFLTKYEPSETISWSTGIPKTFDQVIEQDVFIGMRSRILDAEASGRSLKTATISEDDVKTAVESDTRTEDDKLQAQIKENSVRRMIPWTEKFSFGSGQSTFHIEGTNAPDGRETPASWSDKWSFEYEHYTFSGIRANSAELLKTGIVKADDLTEMDKRLVTSRSVGMALHDGYGVPWAVLNQLDINHWELLREVQTQKSSGIAWGRPRGLLFADLGGTAAQRMLALSSVLAVGAKFERSIVVSWQYPERTPSAERRYPDLFKRELTRSRLIPLRIWACSKGPKHCVDEDVAYTRFLQHRSVHVDNEDIVRKVLVGGVNWKTHIVIKFESPLYSVVSEHEKAQAISNLKPSTAMKARMAHFGNVANTLGVYIGDKLSRKSVDALAERLRGQAGRATSAKYFLAGSDRGKLALLQSRLDFLSVAPRNAPDRGTLSVADKVLEEIAELFALGTECRDVIRDGNCPDSVLDLIRLFGYARRLKQ